ncbi:hypothetical protein PIB30_022601 [Stylosanthes scabra]|uniref:Uncharacterized protein n=1 Tax=Stylosanthes scabra TaxID=79078 RepID=A0ABU6R9Q3_9FABA|nr:hypothetical protein [Stylosanthes scabra]
MSLSNFKFFLHVSVLFFHLFFSLLCSSHFSSSFCLSLSLFLISLCFRFWFADLYVGGVHEDSPREGSDMRIHFVSSVPLLSFSFYLPSTQASATGIVAPFSTSPSLLYVPLLHHHPLSSHSPSCLLLACCFSFDLEKWLHQCFGSINEGDPSLCIVWEQE